MLFFLIMQIEQVFLVYKIQQITAFFGGGRGEGGKEEDLHHWGKHREGEGGGERMNVHLCSNLKK